MSTPSRATVCRTLPVLGYLVALAVAGRPGPTTVLAAAALVATWLIPLLMAPTSRAVPSAAESSEVAVAEATG